MLHPITAKLITRSGKCEATTHRDARTYCESWIETATTAVHTMVHADGDIAVSLYRRDAGRWVRSDGLRQPVPQEKPTSKLLSDLSEQTRSNTALGKYTGNDRGDLKLYTTGDGKRNFLRVCETVPPAEATGPATYKFTLYEVLPPAASMAAIEPTILDAK
jgi:hypothetical protein